MIKDTQFRSLCVAGIISLLFISCSSNVKKADIPSTANPQEEITKLDQDLNLAVNKNIDVLAASDFQDAAKWLTEAKADLSSKQNQEEVLDDVRKGRGFLEKAYATSENRNEKAPGLFESRQMALKAGAGKYSELRSDLQDLDKDVSSKAAILLKTDADTISKLQERYVDLEKRATILTQLGDAQAKFNGSKKDGASKMAPLTFKKTELSLKNAESVIASNTRNPQGYKDAVATATTNVTLLNEVMITIQQNGKNLSETAALKMVAQSGKIKALNKDLSNSNAAGQATQAAMQEKNQFLANELEDKDQQLEDKKQDLSSANANIEIQRVMETARTQFSPDEAEAYQQGGSLLIRLKQVNFASGRSEIPESSFAVLDKVSNVAKSMNASAIKVEGHTDSVGNETVNKSISEKRAGVVANYFKSYGFNDVKSEGYGFQKPIATNKSKEGRALNRRVDIIITPETSTATK
ncbi:MAG: OmpA family protein [Pseudobdellovibrionaceae bacterium]